MPKVLSSKGVTIVEDLLRAMEIFSHKMRDISSDGKAAEIVQLVDECSGRISEVMEA